MSDENLPAVPDPRVTELYMALKLAASLCGKVHLSEWTIEKTKFKPPSDYELTELLGSVLIAESGIEAARKSLELARNKLNDAMMTNAFAEIKGSLR